MYVVCKQCIQGYDSDQLGPLQTYPDIFEKGDYFLFSQKNTSPHVAYLNRFHPSTWKR